MYVHALFLGVLIIFICDYPVCKCFVHASLSQVNLTSLPGNTGDITAHYSKCVFSIQSLFLLLTIFISLAHHLWYWLVSFEPWYFTLASQEFN